MSHRSVGGAGSALVSCWAGRVPRIEIEPVLHRDQMLAHERDAAFGLNDHLIGLKPVPATLELHQA